jgi:HK97 family phage major capsid protein
MSALRELNRSVSVNIENATRARQFLLACRVRALHGEDVAGARAYAEANHLPEIKAAIAPATTTSADFLGPIAQVEPLAAAYIASLHNSSAFDSLLPHMRVVPFRTRVVMTTLGVAGAIVAEGAPKPISSLTLASNEISECKATAIVVLTRELLQLGGPAVMDLFSRELTGAVAATTDQEFIARITAGLTPITSAGPSSSQIRTDAKLALAAVDTNAQSKLFWIVSSSVAKSLSTKEASGASAFPEATVSGGTFLGASVIVSDGLASNTMVLVDATGIAAASGPIEIKSSGQAALQMDSAPTNPPVAATIARSLWQHNEVAIRCERYFGAERLGNSVSVIGGVAY